MKPNVVPGVVGQKEIHLRDHWRTVWNRRWTALAAFLGVLVVLGMVAKKRAAGSLENFFVAGRSLPWWMAKRP